MKWIFQMAWRDTRASRRRLTLYAASIALGIAALVSIASFGKSLQEAVRKQSLTLLGADLVATSSHPFNPDADALFASLGGRQAREIEFSSMLVFPKQAHARLVSVRAVDDGFPFYGTLETVPAAAARDFRDKPAVLVEESLLLQFGAAVGDTVKLGATQFTIAGALRKVPGESPAVSLVAARVYLPMRFLASTQLLQRGSRVQYRACFALPGGVDADRVKDENRERFRSWEIRTETVHSREVSLGRAIENMEGFLSLVAFIALLLGGIGVASGVHVFIRQKLASIAVLRCVGATVRQTFLIYLVQAGGLGFVGAVGGAALGVALQFVLPSLLKGVLPVEVAMAVSWSAVGQGVAAGLGVTLALALLPLLAVRRVSPLLALRSTIEPPKGSWRDPATLGVIAIAVIAVTGFAVALATHPKFGVAFVLGTAVVFGVLALVGSVLMRMARRLMPARAPYVVRQGLANLFRPNNRTLLLILALGLGTFLIVTMQLTQHMLVGELDQTRGERRSNLVLFDIQPDQRAGVRTVIEGQGMTVLDDLPVVTMRLAKLKGRSIEELREDPKFREARWALGREYRSTFRRESGSAEKVIAGKMVSEVAPGTAVIPVSIEEGVAGTLHLKLGDHVTFDVQGRPFECEIGSIRAVEWRRVQPNFFFVFPSGVLEDAPQFIVMATHADGDAQSAQLQRAVLEKYPNVSAIDLLLVLRTVDSVLEKLVFVFRFMSAFVVGTGLVVLAGVMASGRFQRLQESVLLRTIGASRGQIARIQLVEYAMLGALASATGSMLAWAASWGLGRWMFEVEGWPGVAPLFIAWAVVSGLTVFAGWLSCRRLLDHPPLEVLRQEA